MSCNWWHVAGCLEVLLMLVCSVTFLSFSPPLDFSGHAHVRPSTCTSYYVPSSQSVRVKITTALQPGAQIMMWPDMQESNMMFESGRFYSDLPCWSKLARRCAQICSWVRQRSSIIAFHPSLLVFFLERQMRGGHSACIATAETVVEWSVSFHSTSISVVSFSQWGSMSESFCGCDVGEVHSVLFKS